MNIKINSHPIVTDYDIRWLDIEAECEGGLVVRVLKSDLDIALRWVERFNHNVIHCSEGEDITLTPRQYIESDLFNNNKIVQKRLIKYIIDTNK